jgi:hypothetical protein
MTGSIAAILAGFVFGLQTRKGNAAADPLPTAAAVATLK